MLLCLATNEQECKKIIKDHTVLANIKNSIENILVMMIMINFPQKELLPKLMLYF